MLIYDKMHISVAQNRYVDIYNTVFGNYLQRSSIHLVYRLTKKIKNSFH